ncbi:MAG TPA: undecaprenyl-diphosphate phosphatase [Spirochaetota bacterium]|nr:undecaprenyl-diphosphate phosphatase [Spirochaetota bacterium]
MILKVIILGIIEGLTEFLPVSSTGHLILVGKFIDFTGDFANMFDIFIQFGAILAVIIYFRKEIFPDFKNQNWGTDFFQLWSKIIIGFIPAVILGVLFHKKIEEYLFKPIPVAIALIVGGILLIIAELFFKKEKIDDIKKITYLNAFFVGVFQCLALIPGMSRSASTIIGGLFIGFTRGIAVEFSFFLSIPTIMGASFYSLLKSNLSFSSYEWFLLSLGTLVSFVVAFLVIALFMKYIKTNRLYPFSIYRILLAFVVLFISLG